MATPARQRTRPINLKISQSAGARRHQRRHFTRAAETQHPHTQLVRRKPKPPSTSSSGITVFARSPSSTRKLVKARKDLAASIDALKRCGRARSLDPEDLGAGDGLTDLACIAGVIEQYSSGAAVRQYAWLWRASWRCRGALCCWSLVKQSPCVMTLVVFIADLAAAMATPSFTFCRQRTGSASLAAAGRG